MRDELQALGMQVEPFLATDGEQAGQLWPLTRQQGLKVVTCDRAWAELQLVSPSSSWRSWVRG